jgi:hypothetical protein
MCIYICTYQDIRESKTRLNWERSGADDDGRLPLATEGADITR